MTSSEIKLLPDGKDNSDRPETKGAALAYFRKLGLSDIYGRMHAKMKEIPITQEQFHRWNNDEIPTEKRDAEITEFAKQHGIENKAGWGNTSEGTGSIFEYSTRKLTHWMPFLDERRLMLWTAQAVGDHTRSPRFLEVGYGSGIVAKILGATQLTRVCEVDNGVSIQDRYHPDIIPDIPGWVKLLTTDIWDMIHTFGPRFPSEVDLQHQQLLGTLRNTKQSFNNIVAPFYAGQYGDPHILNTEIRSLQALARECTTDSPIDVVLCSFMEVDAELTIPIRDGIVPKAIIYIKPLRGMAGAGNFDKHSDDIHKLTQFWETVENSEHSGADDGYTGEFSFRAEINPDTHISFNPGRNYKVAARWITPDKDIHWDHLQSFGKLAYGSEVIIHLRNDIQLRNLPLPKLEKFPFDFDFETRLEKSKQLDLFLYGLRKAEESLRTFCK